MIQSEVSPAAAAATWHSSGQVRRTGVSVSASASAESNSQPAGGLKINTDGVIWWWDVALPLRSVDACMRRVRTQESLADRLYDNQRNEADLDPRLCRI